MATIQPAWRTDNQLAIDLFLNHFAGVNELSLTVTTGSGAQTIPVGGGGLDLPTLAATQVAFTWW